MNKTKQSTHWMRLAVGGVLLSTFLGVGLLTGCVGYVGPGPGPDVVVGGPDVTIFGGYHGGARYDRDAGHRGFESRSAAGFHGHR